MNAPALLAMLSIQPPIEGDEALLRLARARLGEAGLGGEFYPGSPEHLRELLAFRPDGPPCTAHLPRDIDLLEEEGRQRVLEFARVAAGQLHGLVVHDRHRFAAHPVRTVEALRVLDGQLATVPAAPWVFMEYASDLDPGFYAGLFEQAVETRRVSAAIDVGHVGIHVCRAAYRYEHPREDVCELRPDSPELRDRIDAVQQAAGEALPAVLELIARLARLGKPLHFHLHDGHPLSTLSRFGVSDHLGFLQGIRLPFTYRGRQLLPGMFGLSGLHEIIRTATSGLPADRLSFMLEMHPQDGTSPLREHAGLFAHWNDKSNAERMNRWLDLLLDNAALVRGALAE